MATVYEEIEKYQKDMNIDFVHRPKFQALMKQTLRWSGGFQTFPPHSDVMSVFEMAPGDIAIYSDARSVPA